MKGGLPDDTRSVALRIPFLALQVGDDLPCLFQLVLENADFTPPAFRPDLRYAVQRHVVKRDDLTFYSRTGKEIPNANRLQLVGDLLQKDNLSLVIHDQIPSVNVSLAMRFLREHPSNEGCTAGEAPFACLFTSPCLYE
jgi:hypothetical protein